LEGNENNIFDGEKGESVRHVISNIVQEYLVNIDDEIIKLADHLNSNIKNIINENDEVLESDLTQKL